MSADLPATEPPPWKGTEIAVALFLIYVFWPQLSARLVSASGLVQSYYGPGFSALYQSDPDDASVSAEKRLELRTRVGIMAGAGAADPGVIESEARRIARARATLWSALLAFPLQAITVPLVFFVLSGVTSGRIGLTRRRLGRNLLAGLGGWVLLAPIVFGINLLVTRLFMAINPDAIQQHVLMRLVRQGPTSAEWALIVFIAVVVAPVLEETVYRGVLQPWFAGMPDGGAVAMAMAMAAAVTMRWTLITESLQHGGKGLLTALLAAFFVLAMVPFYLLVARRPLRPESPAIFATALLFASMHAAVWPSPVPLFVLGLGLGTLMARSGSLVGPMVLHGLFNAMTCVMLLLGWE
jgi:membrane protease YdiL (CAAX protease family)